MNEQFRIQDVYPGGVFTVSGEEDGQYILVDIEVVEALLSRSGIASAFEVKMKDGAVEKNVRASIMQVLGTNATIRNRYEQDETFLRIMNIEKWVSYLIAVLTLGIIAFNLVGSLWMIVLDKKKDISILRSMGMQTPGIKNIFTMIGMLVGLVGLAFGIGLSLLLYILQKKFDLVAVPEGFLIDAYPIELRWTDFVIVFFTVTAISYVASVLPSIRAGKVSAYVRQE